MIKYKYLHDFICPSFRTAEGASGIQAQPETTGFQRSRQARLWKDVKKSDGTPQPAQDVGL